MIFHPVGSAKNIDSDWKKLIRIAPKRLNQAFYNDFAIQKRCTRYTTTSYIDSDYPLRRIPGGESLTSVDIVFNSSEILNLDPIADKSY